MVDYDERMSNYLNRVLHDSKPGDADLCQKLNETFEPEDMFSYAEAASRISEHIYNIGKIVSAVNTRDDTIYFRDMVPVFGLTNRALPQPPGKRLKYDADAADVAETDDTENEDENGAGDYIMVSMCEKDPYYTFMCLPALRLSTVNEQMCTACESCGFPNMGLLLTAFTSAYNPTLAVLKYHLFEDVDQSWVVPISYLDRFPSEMMVRNLQCAAVRC